MKERVYRYRAVERQIIESQPGARILDVGCGVGENLARLTRYGGRAHGIDPNLPRLKDARAVAPVAAAFGEGLPWADDSFDMVYVSHVFHHASDLDAALSEVERVLAPGGVLFAIESVDDSPLMRLARWIQPRWQGDDVYTRFKFDELVARVNQHGLTVARGETFNWMYFGWELLPMAFAPLEFFTPLFIGIETLLHPLLKRFGGHCWLVARKPGAPRFPAYSM